MSKENAFAIGVPAWLKDVRDEAIFSAVFGIIASHKIGGEPLTEQGLKDELAKLGNLSEAQQKEAYDLIIAHKA